MLSVPVNILLSSGIMHTLYLVLLKHVSYAVIYLYSEICNNDIWSQKGFLFTPQAEEIQYGYL